jgi:signal transduction histidine kinase
MNRKLLAKLFVISLAVSFILDAVIVVSIRTLNESGEGPIQNPLLRFMGRVIEKGGPSQSTLQTLEAMRTRLGLRVVPVWIVGKTGRIYASSSHAPLPLRWDRLSKPRGIHGTSAHYLPFQLTPDIMILRLSTPRPAYLVLKIPSSGPHHSGLLGHTLFLFSTMAASAFSGLLITFVYLRQKSREAKMVLGRLEKGDLKARFPISRIDEFGSLMTDFNRMAEAIEQVVARVEETDRSRQELLQELGHDLRTPMTSLKAAVDTLSTHGEKMSGEERDRFVQIIRNESEYFLRMIDDLFFIAEVGDPKYRKSAENVNLASLLDSEILASKGMGDGERTIDFHLSSPTSPLIIVGDLVLLKRLFRNALANACRYAGSRVEITLEEIREGERPSGARIRIADDGPGITREDATLFGKRRPRKVSIEQDLSDSKISLGLGSVIMAAIVRIHGGRIEIWNREEGRPPGRGTELVIELPL